MIIKNIFEERRRLFEARNAAELSSDITRLVNQLGFDFFAATVVIEHSPRLTQFQNLTNAPAAFLDFFGNMEASALDPVSQHCKRSSEPIVWNESTYTGSGLGFLWDCQAPFGYRSGIQGAIHLPRGRHFMFGIDCDRRDACSTKDLKQYLEDFLLLLPYIQAAAFEVSDVGSEPAPNPTGLTVGECDLLRWSLDGHSSEQIAKKAFTSITVVELKFEKIKRKLGCVTRYEAILKAIRIGAISC